MKVINLYQLGTLSNLTVISPYNAIIDLLKSSTISLPGIDLGSRDSSPTEQRIVSDFIVQKTAQGRFKSIESAVIQTLKGNTIVWQQAVPDDAAEHQITIPEGKGYISFIDGVKSYHVSEGETVTFQGGRDCLFIVDDIFLTNAPRSVEEFTKIFALDYYDYSAPRVLSNLIVYFCFNGTTIEAPSEGSSVTISATPSGDDIELPDETYPDFWDNYIEINISAMKSDDVLIFPEGMQDNRGAYDYGVVDSDGVLRKVVKVVGTRDYAEGDYDDPTVTTDGITTLYTLDTPIEYTLNTPIDMNYIPSVKGSEYVLPGQSTEPESAPFKANIVYTLE